MKNSGLRSYSRRIVGTDRVFDLILYEILISYLGHVPGALGIFLRSRTYKYLLKNLGTNPYIGYGVILRRPSKISIGNNPIIDDYAVLDAKTDTDTGIAIGDNSRILHGVRISTGYKGFVKIGNNVDINPYSHLSGNGGIIIGDDVLIGGNASIIANNHNYKNKNELIRDQGLSSNGIQIEDDVWIGSGSKILDGVKISKGTVIGAGAVVTKSFPEYSILAGVPAKIIGYRGE